MGTTRRRNKLGRHPRSTVPDGANRPHAWRGTPGGLGWAAAAGHSPLRARPGQASGSEAETEAPVRHDLPLVRPHEDPQAACMRTPPTPRVAETRRTCHEMAGPIRAPRCSQPGSMSSSRTQLAWSAPIPCSMRTETSRPGPSRCSGKPMPPLFRVHRSTTHRRHHPSRTAPTPLLEHRANGWRRVPGALHPVGVRDPGVFPSRFPSAAARGTTACRRTTAVRPGETTPPGPRGGHPTPPAPARHPGARSPRGRVPRQPPRRHGSRARIPARPPGP